MNLDQLPFSAFALEAAGANPSSVGEGQTLTLPRSVPAVIRVMAEPGPVSGTAVAAVFAAALPALHAGVVPADHSPLTITF
jgi:hypothetical protein